MKKSLKKNINVEMSQIRDAYGCSDFMTMLPECEYGYMHVPPWIHISVRNPENLDEEVDENEKGMLGLMAAYIKSFPAFTMPGDMGKVREGTCECGRTGQIVEISGRASSTGQRGCAIRLEEFMKIITND